MVNWLKTHKANILIILLILPICIDVIKDYIKENNEPIISTITIGIILNIIIFLSIDGIKNLIKKGE